MATTKKTTTSKAKPPASDWAAKFSRPSTAAATAAPAAAPEEPAAAPAEVAGEPVAESAPKKAPRRPRRTPAAGGAARGAAKPAAAPVRPRRVIKVPATYRLTEEVLDLIDAVVADARSKGKRLTKEDAVAHAIERTYGRLRH